jgi:hypothetical protein
MSTGAAVARVREALAAAGCQPRGPDARFRARCPAHGSRGGTLAVSQGRAGALIFCHAACTTEDALTAAGLTMADLWDEPRDRQAGPWRPPAPRPSPAEQVGQVIVRVVENMVRREAAQEAASWLLPLLTADERVDLAETGDRESAAAHWREVWDRWSALAADTAYVTTARRDLAAGKAVAEQVQVLAALAGGLVRAAAGRRPAA